MARIATDTDALPRGRVQLALSVIDDDVSIEITDNGKGLPVEKRDRLTEPYMTTRTKGTGLGLAIVKTILEDHSGVLELKDRDDGEPGASIRVTIPLSLSDDQSATAASDTVSADEAEGGVAYGS